ncbi:MAG TPA: ferritin-like domain-containing protein [Thermoleophilaceae bacterium]|jgi:rubrerythrin
MAERTDADLLEDLLATESRLIAIYEAGLRRDVIDAELGERLLAQEREHARALESALAGRGPRNPVATVPPPALGAALRSRDAFGRFALALEAEATAAYVDAAATVRDPKLRQPLGSIMACEAAHQVALRDSRGESLVVD